MKLTKRSHNLDSADCVVCDPVTVVDSFMCDDLSLLTFSIVYHNLMLQTVV